MNHLQRWYKDRDFPEIKMSNADVLAVVENPDQLKRLIDEHNAVLDEVYIQYARAAHALGILQIISDPKFGTSEENSDPLPDWKLRELARNGIITSQALENTLRGAKT